MAKVAAEFGSAANRYQILAKLAVGGMAEIFLARGAGVAGVERYCVLKRIIREHASDVQFVRMFLDEARLAAQLQHPNIASVYDIGMLGDSYFFTMEYVHGETVRSLLQRAYGLRRPVPLSCVLTIIAGAAAGLHHAHERNANDGRPLGIVHRDVSPSNVMVSYEGHVKLVDFGVAKAADRAVQTKSGTVKGKISYLSPEQCRGETIDRRSDLFSLGIVMWEMLTCGRLYRRHNDLESMTAIVYEAPPLPSARRSELPAAIDAIVARLLAKSARERFQSAAEVVEAIEQAALATGTLLSASAVSRWIRELFGIRPEPWLDLHRDTMPFSRLTLESRPVSAQLVSGTVDTVERELAEVLDLSAAGAAELADDLPAPVLPALPALPALPQQLSSEAATPLARPARQPRPPRPDMATIAMSEVSLVAGPRTAETDAVTTSGSLPGALALAAIVPPAPVALPAATSTVTPARPPIRTWLGAGTPPTTTRVAAGTLVVPPVGAVPTVPLRTSGGSAPGFPRDRVVDSPGLRKLRGTGVDEILPTQQIVRSKPATPALDPRLDPALDPSPDPSPDPSLDPSPDALADVWIDAPAGAPDPSRGRVRPLFWIALVVAVIGAAAWHALGTSALDVLYLVAP